jgi:hypothetical protein
MMLVKWIHLRQLTPLADIIASLEGGKSAPAFAPPRQAPPPASPSPRPASASAGSASRFGGGSAPLPSRAATGPSTPASVPTPKQSAPAAPADIKSGLLASIREQNKVFYSMVVAQAKSVEVEGDEIIFTFTPVHKQLKSQLEAKKAWVAQLAQSAAGRQMSIVTRESAPAPKPAETDEVTKHRAALEARVKADPSVQMVIDVFGGPIEDIEEIK